MLLYGTSHLFIHLCIERYLDHFYLLAIMNNTVITICAHILSNYIRSVFLDLNLAVDFSG